MMPCSLVGFALAQRGDRAASAFADASFGLSGGALLQASPETSAGAAAEAGSSLPSHALILLLVCFALIILTARALGEVARRLGQPVVVGEILAGVLLGATVLGRVAPSVSGALFPPSGSRAIVFNSYVQNALIFYMIVAGAEVNLGAMWSSRRRTSLVTAIGIALPFALGLLVAASAPEWLVEGTHAARLPFTLFFGTALAISALPVIVRTLSELDLLGTDFGATVVACAAMNDVVGWLLFGAVLALIGRGGNPGAAAAMVTIYLVVVLTVGRLLVRKALRWLSPRMKSASSMFGIIVAFAMLNAAITDLLGIHAMFGAFLAGAVVSDSPEVPESVRKSLESFASNLAGPGYFASVALQVDVVRNFDLGLVLVVTAIACVGKIVGCSLGARLSGTRAREAFAIAGALNARGAMEIVLGRIALEVGLIGPRLFVALVTMALVTSMMVAPLLRALLPPSAFPASRREAN